MSGSDADCAARLSHHDDIAALVPGLDIDVRLDEVGQRIDAVHNRRKTVLIDLGQDLGQHGPQVLRLF